jgi:probable F420-dependent oxidoreductase
VQEQPAAASPADSHHVRSGASEGASPRPFRFGVMAKGAEDRKAWRELARQAEDRGYSSLVVSDHMGVQFSPVIAAVVAAEATSRLRVGTLVANADLRPPLLLGREACTAGVLTEGRFELGVGAGWMAADYAATRQEMPVGAVRVQRFSEAVEVLARVFGRAVGPFEGQWHRLGQIEPGPLQDGTGPGLLIGAGGERMLRLVGRFADTVSLGRDMSALSAREEMLRAAFQHKYDVLRRAAGERFAEIEVSVFAMDVVLGMDGHAAAQELARRHEVTLAEASAAPEHLLGELAAIRDRLLANREELAISYVVVPVGAMGAFGPVVQQLAGQ